MALAVRLLSLGSPRVCVRRDYKHAQGKVLKARACWVLQLALAASARWLAAGVLAAQAVGSGLGHPATTPAPFSHVSCWHLLFGLLLRQVGSEG